MKLTRLFLLIILVFSFACSDDKNPTEPNDNDDNEDVDTFLADVDAYLSNNSYSLDPNDITTFSTISDSLVNNATIILTGENHGTVLNTQLNLAFIKYLNTEYNVRNVLLELGYSTSKYFQNYLSTGDISIVQHVFDYLEGTIYYSKEQYQFWQDVYEYNSALPSENKLRIIGIDVEHQYITAITYLESIIPEEDPPQEISSFFSSLKDIVEEFNYDRDYIKTFSRDFKNSLTNNYNTYAGYLGNEKVVDYEIVLKGMDAAFTWYDNYQGDNVDGYNFRENYMYNQFKIFAGIYSGEKFYGQFGVNHILQQNLGGVDWLASQMNFNNAYSGKVLSIPYFYQFCSAMGYITGDYYEYFLSTVGEGFEFLVGYNLGNTALFNLTGPNSPLASEEYLHYYSPGGNYATVFTQVMTNYFQSAILVQSSDAMQPYR